MIGAVYDVSSGLSVGVHGRGGACDAGMLTHRLSHLQKREG